MGISLNDESGTTIKKIENLIKIIKKVGIFLSKKIPE